MGARNMLARTIGAWRRLARDRRGAAAIEFAFIAPVLLSLYFVTMEVAQGIEANKKIARVASMTADLLTQQQTLSKSEVEAIMRIGEAILQPYNRTKPTITVTAITITDENTPKVKVLWSRRLTNGSFGAGLTKDSITTVPEKLKVRNSFLMRVESQLNYKPVIVWTAQEKAALGLAAAFDNISMEENYYLRPRMSTSIPCSDC